MTKVGDIVRYLNAVGGGRVVRIEGNIAVVDDDGFETPVLLKECVVVGNAAAQAAAVKQPSAEAQPQPQPLPSPAPQPGLTASDIAETPEGDKLNVVLAYEPSDLKNLSQSVYDTYLVNDSNYYLYFTYLTRSNESPDGWTTRYAGIVEPNIQVFLETLERDELAGIDHVAVQLVAFKQDKPFTLKAPVAVEYKLDTTRFFKLHCFRENVYFDEPVIALDVVKDDVPARVAAPDVSALERELNAKKRADSRPRRRPVVKRTSERRTGDIIEVDLHISELVDNTRGLSAADMLNLQIDEFRRVMDANLTNHGQKIVFIHGKGEGVLRNALTKELTHRYKGHDVRDASFQEYGFGATQVTIH